MFNWLKSTPIDRNDDIERLEQRIRDIRRRIWEAQNPKEPILPTSRMDLQTPEKLRQSLIELRRSVGEGPEISEQSTNRTEITEAERIKQKLLGKTSTKKARKT